MTGEAREPQKGDIAFWRYDQYPYLLHGTVADVSGSTAVAAYHDGWSVHVEEYGVGTRFLTSFILPPEPGRMLAQRLDGLRAQCQENIADTLEYFKGLAKDAIEEVRETADGRA